jgi:hypothetical protein
MFRNGLAAAFIAATLTPAFAAQPTHTETCADPVGARTEKDGKKYSCTLTVCTTTDCNVAGDCAVHISNNYTACIPAAKAVGAESVLPTAPSSKAPE